MSKPIKNGASVRVLDALDLNQHGITYEALCQAADTNYHSTRALVSYLKKRGRARTETRNGKTYVYLLGNASDVLIDTDEAPACFESADQFLDWQFAAKYAAKMGGNQPVNYCHDCTPDYKRKMGLQARCSHPYVRFITDEEGGIRGSRLPMPQAKKKQAKTAEAEAWRPMPIAPSANAALLQFHGMQRYDLRECDTSITLDVRVGEICPQE